MLGCYHFAPPGRTELAEPIPGAAAPSSGGKGRARQLPLPDSALDLALCQQGPQFLPGPAAALREMHGVLGPGVLIIVERASTRIDRPAGRRGPRGVGGRRTGVAERPRRPVGSLTR
jgi:SAM-dependent methyltransferase